MPHNSDCISKHRQKKNVNCSGCSIGYHFTISSLLEVDDISAKMLESILEKKEWSDSSKNIEFVVRCTLLESILNSIEHGLLGIDKAAKKIIREQKGDEYETYIEKEWQKKNIPISISFCINDNRVLIGVHDDGAGFNHAEQASSSIQNKDLLGVSGRGLAILKGFGVKLHWNDAGNSILCSFKRPAPPPPRAARGKLLSRR